MASEYFKAFSSVAIDLVPISPFFNAPGAFGYPFTTWGGRAKVKPNESFYVMAGAYNGDPKVKAPDQHGLDFSMNGPVFAIGELGFHWQIDDGALYRPGNFKLGTFYNGGSFSKFLNPNQSEQGLYGFYAIIDQVITRWGKADDKGHLGVFGSFVASPDESISIMPYYFNAGLVAYGPFPSRPSDYLNLGVAYGAFSSDLRSAQQAARLSRPSTVVQHEEVIFELGNGCVVHPGLLIQPDLQIILNHGGDRSLPTALALGVNIVVNL